MKRLILFTGIVIALLAGGWITWTYVQPSLTADDSTRQTVTIERGDILSTVKATNRLEARAETVLSFDLNGVVAEVLVERGQTVRTGDPLARLDTSDLELQLAQAEANLDKVKASARPEDIAAAEASLRSAQANYEKIAAGATAEDITVAQASLNSAWANYNALKEGPDDDEITVAAANFRNAEISLQNAQWAYDKIAYVDNIGETPQAAELQRATISYESALASYKLAVQGASDEQLVSAWAQVEQAQAQLDKLNNGPTVEELAMAQAQIDQAQAQLDKLLNTPTPEDLQSAQLQVDQARLNLSKATLTAPIDGVVTEVNITVGERPAGYVVRLADLSVLQIELQVDEIDLPAVSVGQPAVIVLDALPDSPMTGQVMAIAPAPVSSASGVAGYEVTVTLDEQAKGAKVGMTANVDIETSRREDVVVIPAHLIQVDKTTGQTYVERSRSDGQVERVDVNLGVRSGQTIEVLDGLEAGDQILLPLSDQEQDASSEGNFFTRMRQARESAPGE